MHFFTNTIQPLTQWLSHHPHLALLITFLISFTESLAIIGSIIPGSITMTAIGILAGSGIMRIDLTFLAATLGAIAGDGGSYTIGYLLSDRLTSLWPFNRFPTWLVYGKLYFHQHGSTSVLIGRFFGPMRSIIPLIAGMMHMNRWHFLLANIISGIAWAILYVAPGVLIGTAGSALSPESATRLFVIILMLLIILWLASLGLKWLLLRAPQLLHTNLHFIWIRLKKNHLLKSLAKRLAPKNEVNHYMTAGLTLLFLLSFIMALLMVALVLQGSMASILNYPIYLFLQSLRIPSCDSFFIILSLIISPIPLSTFFLSFTFYTLYYRDWRALGYWLSLSLTTPLILLFIIPIIENQAVGNLLLRDLSLQWLSMIDLTLATALFGFFILYVHSYFHSKTLLIFRIILFSILCLSGLGFIYLGDNWFITIMASYCIGFSLCLIHWIFFRRLKPPHQRRERLIWLTACPLILGSALSYTFYFDKLVHAHSPELPQYVLTENKWWNQSQNSFPIYTTNRIGKPIGLLNIQYVGSITELANTLKTKGWIAQSTSFFKLLVLRAAGPPSAEGIPLMAQLYLNRKPTITMIYNPGNQQGLLVLRLWRSNYHIPHYHEPIWLGNLAPQIQYKPGKLEAYQAIAIHNYLIQSLSQFKFKQIWLPKSTIKSLPYLTSRLLLLIKEPQKNPALATDSH